MATISKTPLIELLLNGNLNNTGSFDATITGNNVTVASDGYGGQCYSFNGSSSYLASSATPFSNSTTEWSYSCWFKPNSSHNGCLFSNRTAVSSAGITVFYYNAQFYIDDGTRWSVTPSVPVSVGKWNHIVVTVKKGTGKALYLNGQQVGTTTATGTASAANSSNFSIGSNHNGENTIGGSNRFNGYIRDVKIYGEALTAEEVTAIHSNGRTIPLAYELTAIGRPDTYLEGDILNCDYSGEAQELTLPAGSFQLQCWGAQGGLYNTSTASPYCRGGYSIGTLTLEEETQTYVYVGGQGEATTDTNNIALGGFNGGGACWGTEDGNAGGGGGTDIRLGEDSLYARVIVAGGGGGEGEDNEGPGYGGGLTAGNSGGGVSGGTQTGTGTGGAFGKGASTNYDGGGCGGGWYGGGTSGGTQSIPTSRGSGSDTSGGSGGSGYVYTASTAVNYPSGCLLDDRYYLEDAQTIGGNTNFVSTTGETETGHSGNGYARITILEITPVEEPDYAIYDVDDYAIPTTSGKVQDFDYTGDVQTTILSPGTYKLECWGAQGGENPSNAATYYGGKGGYSVGTITITQDTIAYIYSGGQGNSLTSSVSSWTILEGGFNGGGKARIYSTNYPGSGGGGTDIRIGQDSLYARVIVAGGGGGAGYNASQTYGFYGGGSNGGGGSAGTGSVSSTSYSSDIRTTYGSQTSPGDVCCYQSDEVANSVAAAFGLGGFMYSNNTSNTSTGGGGGGWYGGGARNHFGGGGGSGYVYTSSTSSNYPSGCLLNSSYYLTDAETIAGNVSFDAPDGSSEVGHSGNGFVRITQLSGGDVPPEEEPEFPTLYPRDRINCDYSGTKRAINLPPGLYNIKCYGGQGGSGMSSGGKGGYSEGNIRLYQKERLYIYVGGSGKTTTTANSSIKGGYNGGGSAITNSTSYSVGSGGGASDVRLREDSLYARLIVAGGGGGSGGYNSTLSGGTGGGLTGSDGTQYSTSYYSGRGGTQYKAGDSYYGTTLNSTTYFELATFGKGASASSSSYAYSAGGGSGWYGGGGSNYSGAGGGSGYVFSNDSSGDYPDGCLLSNKDLMTDVLMENGKQRGNGKIIITVIDQEQLEYEMYDIDDYAVIMSQPIYDYEYTGTVQTTTLQPGTYKLECWGAQGGQGQYDYNSADPGKGGYSIGTVTLNSTQTIYVYVGGSGSPGLSRTIGNPVSGGFNGGGDSGYNGSSNNNNGGGSGGGGSDIRIGTDSLYARIIVAGGGGGGGNSWSNTAATGGSGGGTSGISGISGGESGASAGSNTWGSPGGAGTQTSGGVAGSHQGYTGTAGSFGIGGSGYTGNNNSAGGGGGGGWYGGGPGSQGYSAGSGAGGGGSGYVYTSSTASNYPSGCLLNSSYYLSDAQTITGNTSFTSPEGTSETGHSGNGYVRITQLSYIPPEVEPVTFNPGDRIECSYNGSARAVYLSSGKYKIDCYGAQGGNAMAYGGRGGYSTGVLTLTEDTYLFIYVGGKGKSTVDTSNNAKGGFNGGGDARTASTSYHCGSGGGASDIRIGTDSLLSRVIVAGGGGGSGGLSATMNGGIGGGLQGEDGTEYNTSYYRGRAGTQTSAGISWYGTTSNNTSYYTLADFGHGGSATASSYEYRSGGGGGFYGGGGSNYSGAGGGSGYVYTSTTASRYPSGCTLNSDYYLADAMMESGRRGGNGYILITVVDTNYFDIKDIEMQSSSGAIQNFEYTGDVQTVTLDSGIYQLECWGAQGGQSVNCSSYLAGYGGKGGYSVGTISISSPTTLYIIVGGEGGSGGSGTSAYSGAGGFGGGGSGGKGWSSDGASGGAGGGGLSGIFSSLTYLNNEIIIAGGGGGGGGAASSSGSNHGDGSNGGAGGGLSGENGSYTMSQNTSISHKTSSSIGYGGTQSSSPSGSSNLAGGRLYGSAGYGNGNGNPGNGTTLAGGASVQNSSSSSAGGSGGGGGGYYGGTTGYQYGMGAGGGSGYVSSSLSDTSLITGNNSIEEPDGTSAIGHSGNGYVRITQLDYIDPTEEIPKLKFKSGDIVYAYQSNKNHLVYLPKGIYQVECYGGQGGYGSYTKGGLGGYSKGLLFLPQKQNPIYLTVGGMGKTSTSTSTDISGGYNGGGSAYTTSSAYYGGSGGGASDVRIDSNSLYARVIVAGGGGGGSGQQSNLYVGGSGGGTSGDAGYEYSTSYKAGTGGTQSSAGVSYYETSTSSSYQDQPSFGQGGGHKSGTSTGYHCGGGGGWYGGGGSASGSAYLSGAGGGSGYVYTENTASNYPQGCLLTSDYYLTEASTTGGQHYGDGYIRITVIDAKSINIMVKVNNHWLEAEGIVTKINNHWLEGEGVVVMINNTWVASG